MGTVAQNPVLSRTFFRALRNVVAAELLLLGLAALVGYIYQARNVHREEAIYGPPGQKVDLGGYSLHLYCTGSGSPTVVLDFGLDGSYLDWYLVQPRIAQFTRVCSYDRAGYGWSDVSPKARVPSVMSEELQALLERAGEKPPYILVGHSFGAFDVRMYVHKFPNQVAGVVLVDGSHPDEVLPFSWKKKAWLRLMQLSMPFGLPRWRRWCGTGPAEAGAVRQAIACRSKPFATHYAQWSAFSASADEVRRLGPLGNIPLVVISRDPDRAPDLPGDPEFAMREQNWNKLQASFLQLSTDARQVIAKGSGHSVPSARPDAIADAIRDMVEKIRNKNATADR
ncbi:MAG TPA: alpha/beta hydrolase [Terriglobales bacterium]|nr:alpha/beta hydrolase [Terriglobales bacterium]